MSAERRRSTRYKVELPARLSLAEEELPGLLRDICRDAALIESPRTLALGTPLGLTLELPESGLLQVAGSVIRQAEPQGEIHPLAVLFTELKPAAATLIDLFLARLEVPGR